MRIKLPWIPSVKEGSNLVPRGPSLKVRRISGLKRFSSSSGKPRGPRTSASTRIRRIPTKKSCNHHSMHLEWPRSSRFKENVRVKMAKKGSTTRKKMNNVVNLKKVLQPSRQVLITNNSSYVLCLEMPTSSILHQLVTSPLLGFFKASQATPSEFNSIQLGFNRLRICLKLILEACL